MKRYKLAILVGLLLAMALHVDSALASPVAAWEHPLDRIITGEDYVLESGQVERGAIAVLAGSVTIEDGATVDGDLTALAGDVSIAGTVDGSVVVLGGSVNIDETAVISGDCVLFGGQVQIDEAAQVDGEIVTNPEGGWLPFRGAEREFSVPEIPGIPEVPGVPDTPRLPDVTAPRVVVQQRTSFAERVGGAFLTAIGAGVAALLITLFWPRHTDRVRSTIIREPVASGLVGFATFVAAGLITPVLLILATILIIVLCVGLLGYPLIAFAWLLILAAGLLGWSAIGLIAGRWMVSRLGLQGVTPAMEAGLGAFAITLILGVVGAIWFVGVAAWLANLVLASMALGATILTRFGRRDYQRGQPILPAAKSETSRQLVETETHSEGVQPDELEADAAEEREGDPPRFDPPPLESEGPFPEK
jgi:cytoskeletal protein CcmA (bactofilin family)